MNITKYKYPIIHLNFIHNINYNFHMQIIIYFWVKKTALEAKDATPF